MSTALDNPCAIVKRFVLLVQDEPATIKVAEDEAINEAFPKAVEDLMAPDGWVHHEFELNTLGRWRIFVLVFVWYSLVDIGRFLLPRFPLIVIDLSYVLAIRIHNTGPMTATPSAPFPSILRGFHKGTPRSYLSGWASGLTYW